MALRLLTEDYSNVAKSDFKRLDAKYYWVNNKFDKLENKSKLKVSTLEELEVNISSGSYIDTYISKEDGGIPYIRVGNIKTYSINERHNNLVFVSPDVPSKMKVKQNDILVARTQATIHKLGISSIIDLLEPKLAISQHVSKLTVNENYLSAFYLIAYLNSKAFKAQTALASYGDTRVELTHSQLKRVRVFLPKEDFYKYIENMVEKILVLNRESINKILSAEEIIQTELSNLKKNNEKEFSVSLSQLKEFSMWNTTAHLPLYVKYENQISKNYTTIVLDDIAKIKKGVEPGQQNYNTDLFKGENDYPFIRTSDIVNNEIDLYPDYFVSESIEDIESGRIESGDLLFTKDGIIGETSLATEFDKVVVASGFAVISLKNNAKKYNITAEYLFAILSNDITGLFPALRRTVIASTIPHLRPDRLKEIKIPVFDKKIIDEITILIKEAFRLKSEKKKLILKIRQEIDEYSGI